MKNQFFIQLKVAFAFSFIFLFANTASAQMFLEGKWKVSCAIESVDASSMKFCDICPSKINKAEASIIINSLEFSIHENTISITPEGEQKADECKFESDNVKSTIEFKYNKQEYKFDVMLIDANNKILREDKTGLLLLMTKK